ncbi:hypothetical protein M405DRAFT_260391 [Rhizopogon salebrosus TDB-379]|nr:hypothetical protein M405DRAFT_260391 [Rhizopogon salebrosus TDB-379]
MADEDTNLKVQQFLDSLPVKSGFSRYLCLFSHRVLRVLIYSAVSRCSLCPRTRSCHHLWLLLVNAPQERTCFPRTPHHALFLSALLTHRAARSIDPHRSIRCTPCELSLKVLAHLNATSLRRTAQVSEG